MQHCRSLTICVRTTTAYKKRLQLRYVTVGTSQRVFKLSLIYFAHSLTCFYTQLILIYTKGRRGTLTIFAFPKMPYTRGFGALRVYKACCIFITSNRNQTFRNFISKYFFFYKYIEFFSIFSPRVYGRSNYAGDLTSATRIRILRRARNSIKKHGRETLWFFRRYQPLFGWRRRKNRATFLGSQHERIAVLWARICYNCSSGRAESRRNLNPHKWMRLSLIKGPFERYHK